MVRGSPVGGTISSSDIQKFFPVCIFFFLGDLPEITALVMGFFFTADILTYSGKSGKIGVTININYVPVPRNVLMQCSNY